MVSTKEIGSDWLKADDITDGDTAVILDEATVEDTDFGKQLQCTLEYKGEKKKFGFNKTNTGIMEEFIGDETKDWAGKTIWLYKNPTQFKGKQVMGVRIGIPPQSAKPQTEAVADAPAPAAPANPDEETPAQKCAKGEHLPTTLAGGKKVCGHCAVQL